MDIAKLRKELDKIYGEIIDANFSDLITRKVIFKLINYNHILLNELIGNKLASEKQTVSIESDTLEKHFTDGVYEIINNGATLNVDILNWYRNLYYKENGDTERGIMAHVINNLFMEMQAKGIKLTGLYISPEHKEVQLI